MTEITLLHLATRKSLSTRCVWKVSDSVNRSKQQTWLSYTTQNGLMYFYTKPYRRRHHRRRRLYKYG